MGFDYSNNQKMNDRGSSYYKSSDYKGDKIKTYIKTDSYKSNYSSGKSNGGGRWIALAVVIVLVAVGIAAVYSNRAMLAGLVEHLKEDVVEKKDNLVAIIEEKKQEEKSSQLDEVGNNIIVPAITPSMIAVAANTTSIGSSKKAGVEYYSGSLTEKGQVDSYYFTAINDGNYRVDISEVQSGTYPAVYIYDSLGAVCGEDYYCYNGEGATAYNLKRGQTYEIVIRQNNGFTDYDMTLHYAKAAIDLSETTFIADSIEFAGQVNTYSFTPPLNGTYRFQMSEMMNGTCFSMYLYDRLGATVAEDYYCYNNEGITGVNLKAGETYTFTVNQHNGISSYNLDIGFQKPTLDISSNTELTDSIEFYSQRNLYTFTPVRDGTYRFEVSEMMSGTTFQIYLFNSLGETVAEDYYCYTGEGLTASDLQAGSTYLLELRQSNGLSGYQMTIGQQKETVNIERGNIISDSVEYTGQDNVYNLYCDSSDSINLTISECQGNAEFRISVYNYLSERIAYDEYFRSGERITINNPSHGEYFEVHLQQKSNVSSYVLTVD